MFFLLSGNCNCLHNKKSSYGAFSAVGAVKTFDCFGTYENRHVVKRDGFRLNIAEQANNETIRRGQLYYKRFVCFCQQFFRVWGKPTPKRTKRHPNDEKRRQDEPPKQRTSDEPTQATRTARRTNRKEDRARDRNDGRNERPTERKTDEESERTAKRGAKSRRARQGQGPHRHKGAERRTARNPTQSKNTTKTTNEKQNGKTTQGTPPKKLIAFGNFQKCYKVYF